MASTPKEPKTYTPVFFFPTIYNETLKLMADALNYFQYYGPQDQAMRTAQQRLFYSCEMSRITMRLSCVMAWLMARKAFFAGKISAERVLKEFRLDSREICLHQNVEAEESLPSFMSHMLERSLELYERTARLDDLSAKTLNAKPK